MFQFEKAESIATNTLLVPDVPKCFFGCDDAMLLIHDAFAEFGPLFKVVPMKGFRRIMIIYQQTAHAITAKQELDKQIIVYKEHLDTFPDIIKLTHSWDQPEHDLFTLRVYFGQHYTINPDPSSLSLQVPQFQRNLLISPPGSPFEGWQQIEEDAPNQSVLASDLVHATHISDYDLDNDAFSLDTTATSIVCAQGTTLPSHLPAITVQDWDTHVNKTDEEISTDARRKMIAAPTALPPTSK